MHLDSSIYIKITIKNSAKNVKKGNANSISLTKSGTKYLLLIFNSNVLTITLNFRQTLKRTKIYQSVDSLVSTKVDLIVFRQTLFIISDGIH